MWNSQHDLSESLKKPDFRPTPFKPRLIKGFEQQDVGNVPYIPYGTYKQYNKFKFSSYLNLQQNTLLYCIANGKVTIEDVLKSFPAKGIMV